MASALILKPGDSVAVCIQHVSAGEIVNAAGEKIKALEDIPMPHKIACRDIPFGEPVIKYSQIIGYAFKDIKAGEWVHTHNVSPDRKSV